MAAILHNTVTPTVLTAGSKTNVVPGSASCELDGRYLPGVTLEQFLQEIQTVVGPELELEVLEHGPPAASAVETPLWHIIGEVVGERLEGTPIVPNLTIGFTDSKWLERLGVHMYGFTPLNIPPGVRFTELFHGDDERAPVDGFRWGVETLWQTVARFLQGAGA